LLASLMLMAGCGKSGPAPVAQGKPSDGEVVKKPAPPPEPPPDPGPPKGELDPPKPVPDVPKVDPPPPPRAGGEFDRLLRQAGEALKAKQYAEAVRALETALDERPGDAAAAKELADARAALAADREEKKKLDEYQAHMTAGRAALKAQRYADALGEFLAARRLLPGDPAATEGVNLAEVGLQALADQDRRRTEYARLMAQAADALRSQRYDEAIRAYTSAEKLIPRDADALRGLQEARKAQAADAKLEHLRLMRLGDAAFRAGRYDEAVLAYEEAARLQPGDSAATRALRQAQDALKEQSARQADYDKYMKAGATAFKQKRYDEAARAYNDALRLYPGDSPATYALRDVSFAQHMADGEQAMRGKKFAEAVKAFEAALLLKPGDREAATELKQAQGALGTLSDRQLAEYEKHMKEGQTALQQKKYADAVKDFEAALKIKPGDVLAAASLQQAKAGISDTTAKLAEYEKNMKEGQAALKAKKYAEAVREFEQALQAKPGDQAATQALRQAQQALADMKDYDKHMKDGQTAMQQKKYADAVKDFEQALKAKPNDQAAMTALQQAKLLADGSGKQAEYEKNMKEGQAALKANKFADAAKEFEQALKSKPGDPAAMLALKQAQQGMAGQKEYDKYMKDGQAAMRAKKYADAVKAFEAALRVNPGDKQAAAELKKAKAALK
jgi:tetratricopeptide (TPR) repeat protein